MLSLAWFVRVEQRAAEPITPPRLFTSREFTLTQILSLLVGAILVSVINYLPQYMQFVQGASPTVSGMLILPLMLAMLTAQLTTGRLMDRGGLERVVPLVGGAVTVAGALLLLLLGSDTPLAAASALTLVIGVGVGILMQSTLLTTMNNAAPRDMGAATGTVTLVRTIGGSLGVAVLGAVHSSRLDVVVEGVPAVGLGQLDEVHARGHPEVARLGRAVRVAERGPLQRGGGQPEVRGAETGRRPDHLAAEVQRTVHRSPVRGLVVVGAAEDPALPAPAVAAGVRGEPAVAGAGDELRAVGAVRGQRPQDRPARRARAGRDGS